MGIRVITNYTHVCYTKELFPDYLCNHFGLHSSPHSKIAATNVYESGEGLGKIGCNDLVVSLGARCAELLNYKHCFSEIAASNVDELGEGLGEN